MMQSPAAFGLYPSTHALHAGADALRAARFRQTDISVMYSDGSQALQLRETTEPVPSVVDDEPETIGSVLSSLSGVRAFATRHDGPILAAGPILATLAQASANLLATLLGLGIPQTLAERFEDRLKHGGLLLSVQCDDNEWADRARQIFIDTGAEQVTATV